MTVFRWPWPVAIAIVLVAGPQVRAQSPAKSPHVGYVYPGGGCRGTTIEVVVGGEDVKQVTDAYVTGGGIQPRIGRWYRPMTQGEYVGVSMKISHTIEELEKVRGKGKVPQ